MNKRRNEASKRITISLPSHLFDEIKKHVGQGDVSDFLVQAATQKLARRDAWAEAYAAASKRDEALAEAFFEAEDP